MTIWTSRSTLTTGIGGRHLSSPLSSYWLFFTSPIISIIIFFLLTLPPISFPLFYSSLLRKHCIFGQESAIVVQKNLTTDIFTLAISIKYIGLIFSISIFWQSLIIYRDPKILYLIHKETTFWTGLLRQLESQSRCLRLLWLCASVHLWIWFYLECQNNENFSHNI